MLEATRRLNKDKEIQVMLDKMLDEMEERRKNMLEVVEKIEKKYESNEIDEKEEVRKRGLGDVVESVEKIEKDMIEIRDEMGVSLERYSEMIQRIRDERKEKERGTERKVEGAIDSMEIENKVEIEKEKVETDTMIEKGEIQEKFEKK